MPTEKEKLRNLLNFHEKFVTEQVEEAEKENELSKFLEAEQEKGNEICKNFELSFGPKYRDITPEINQRQIEAIKSPTPPEIQTHGVKLYQMLENEGKLGQNKRILDIGTSDGDKLTEYLASRPFNFQIDFVEPSNNIELLRANSKRLAGKQVAVYHQTVEQFFADSLVLDEEIREYDLITLNLSLQYFPEKLDTIQDLFLLTNLDNPNTTIEILLTGPKHGQEFVPIYDEANRNLGLDLPNWDCGMVENCKQFKESLNEAGYDCEVHDLVEQFRVDDVALNILTRREKVQSALLYPASLEKVQKDVFREEMVKIIEKRFQEQGKSGETVHVLRFSIKSRNQSL